MFSIHGRGGFNAEAAKHAETPEAGSGMGLAAIGLAWPREIQAKSGSGG